MNELFGAVGRALSTDRSIGTAVSRANKLAAICNRMELRTSHLGRRCLENRYLDILVNDRSELKVGGWGDVMKRIVALNWGSLHTMLFLSFYPTFIRRTERISVLCGFNVSK